MSIILRTLKGSALTYEEMDRNLSQFFYSSSIHNGGAILRFHYTGSDTLDTVGGDFGPTPSTSNRYHEVPLFTADQVQGDGVAGNDKEVQFNDGGEHGADPLFVFQKTNNLLGIGTATPDERLSIHGDNTYSATISLHSITSNPATTKRATVEFLNGSTLVGQIGKTVDQDAGNIYISNKYEASGERGKIHFSVTGPSTADSADVVASVTNNDNTKAFGIGTKTPNRQISVVGDEGLGISNSSAALTESYLTAIPSQIFSETIEGVRRLVPNTATQAGLLISSPNSTNGGNVVVAINTDTGNKDEAFTIIDSNEGDYSNSEVVFSAQANGAVGINTNFATDIGLTVAGNISGSGTLQVETIATGTADSTSALVATETGLVQKIAAAPVPVGGIIMWSGATSNIPDGWRLCEAGVGTVNGVVVPDLTDRFVVGAGATYSVAGTGGSADAVVVSHDHGGNTTEGGNHSHFVAKAGSETTNNINSLYDGSGAQRNDQPLSTRAFDQSSDLYDYELTTSSGTADAGKTNNSGNHQHGINSAGESGIGKNLPPYYALAFIIYVGV